MSIGFKINDRDLKDYIKAAQRDIQQLNTEIIRMSVEIKEKNSIIEMLMSENEMLRSVVKEETNNIDKSDIFLTYICSYYKTSIDNAKPFVKQMLSYFLRNEFKMTLNNISLILKYRDHSTVIYNIEHVNDALTNQRKYIKDVLIHREWLRKLNEIK